MAELIQADWEKIGVKAKLVTYEWAEYRKRSKTGEQAAMMFGWSGDNGDPDNFFVPLLGCEAVKGGGNVARWCNKPFEDLIIKAAQTPKQADRAKLYEQAQVIVKEEAPWITLAHSVRFDPLRKEVQGLQDGRDGAPLLHQRRSREAAVTRSLAPSPPSDEQRCAGRRSRGSDARRVARRRVAIVRCSASSSAASR